MVHLLYTSIDVSNAVVTVPDARIPDNATHVHLQADVNDIRYTMDDQTDPSTSSGMILHADHAGGVSGVGTPPITFLIEDLKRGRFIRDGANDSVLHLHFFAGRDV
jgi:hypothetical protein